MRPLSFSLEFRGFASAVRPGELRVRATAPSSSFVTVVSAEGLSGHVGSFGTDEAVLEARLVFSDGEVFDETGTVVAGRGNEFRFRTLDRARFQPTEDPNVRHAAAVLQIDGGEGQFANASGRIASNLLLSDTLDVTDCHVGLLYVATENRNRAV